VSGLCTTTVQPASADLTAIQAALNGCTALTFPAGKTAANIRSFILTVDVNGAANLQVITT